MWSLTSVLQAHKLTLHPDVVAGMEPRVSVGGRDGSPGKAQELREGPSKQPSLMPHPHSALFSYLGHFTISGCENEVGFVQASDPAGACTTELPANKNWG